MTLKVKGGLVKMTLTIWRSSVPNFKCLAWSVLKLLTINQGKDVVSRKYDLWNDPQWPWKPFKWPLMTLKVKGHIWRSSVPSLKWLPLLVFKLLTINKKDEIT